MDAGSLAQKESLYQLFLQSYGAQEEAVRQAAAIGEPAVPWLVEWLQHHASYVRRAAADSLIQIGSPHIVEHLKPVLTLNYPHDYHDKREYSAFSLAVEILARSTVPGAGKCLFDFLTSKHEFVAQRTSQVLSQGATQQVISEIVEQTLTANAQQAKRNYCIRKIGFSLVLGFWSIMLILMIWLQDGSDFPYLFVFFLNFISALISLLGVEKMTSVLTRGSYVARVISMLNHPELLGVLIELTQITDTGVKKQVYQSLNHHLEQVTSRSRRLVTPEQVKILTSILPRHRELHETTAQGFIPNLIRALEHLGTEETLKVLKKFAQDPTHPMELRLLAKEVGGRLEVRLVKEKEFGTLMRVPTEEAEISTLLRAADPQPDIPPEQLMRPPENHVDE